MTATGTLLAGNSLAVSSELESAADWSAAGRACRWRYAMKAPETKLQQSQYTTPPLSHRDDGIETDWGGVFYPATPGAPIDEWRPGFWDALVGYAAYIDPERLRDPEDVVSEGEASEARTAGTSASARLHRSS